MALALVANDANRNGCLDDAGATTQRTFEPLR